MSGNTLLLGLDERMRPDVEWLELDGSILRRDPEGDVFYATLIVRRPVFREADRVAALARLMNTVAPLPGNRPVTPDHFPQKGPVDEVPNS